MIKSFQAYPGDNFSGGLVTTANPFQLDDNQSPNVMNCYSDIYKTLWSRKGYEKINEIVAASTTNYGMYEFPVREGDRKLMAQFGTVLYKMDNLDGTLDSLQTGLPADDMEYTEINKILVFKSWTPSSAYYWDGITATASEIVQFPLKGVNPIQWNQHIFYFTEDSEQNKLKYSDYNSYLLYDPANYYYTSDGQPITALETVRGRMVMFKAYGIDRAAYLGGIPLLEVKNIVNGVGCSSKKAIKKAHTKQYGEVLFFPTSDNQIVMFNGSEIKFISEPIDMPNDESPFRLKNMSEACAVVDQKRGWYICFFGDYGIVYDYNLNSWWPFDNQGFEAATGTYLDGETFQVVTSKDGYIYKWFSSDDDDGDAIDAYWDSPHISLKQPKMIKKGYSSTFNYRCSGNQNLVFKKRLNFNKAFSEGINMPQYPEGFTDFLGKKFTLGQSTLGSKYDRDFTIDIREEWLYYQYRVQQSVFGKPFRVTRGSVYQKSEGLVVQEA